MIASLFLVVFFIFFLISLTGCQISEALPEPDLPDAENGLKENESAIQEDETLNEEENERINEAASEEVDQDFLLTFSFPAGEYIVSPGGDLLYFTMPSAPGTLYHVIDLSEVEIGSENVPEIEWEALEPLETPSIMGNTYHLKISDDGSNLLYAASEILWDETEYGEKTVIYFSRPDFPPVVYHQLELIGDEVPDSTFAGSGIMPVWESATDNVYFLTLSGIYRYSTGDRRKTLICPAAELPGLTSEGQLAPHAFYLEGENNEMAYYSDGTLYLLSLVDRNSRPEKVKVDCGDNNIVGLKYIFGGSFLVLENGHTHWGFGLHDLSLTFVDRQSGEVVLEGNSYLPAGYIFDDQGQMFFKSLGPDNQRYFVLLDSSLREISRVSAKGIIPAEEFFSFVDIIRLGGRWALPINIGMEADFVEIGFD